MSCVYVAAGGSLSDYSFRRVESTLHHEISSLLLHRYSPAFPHDEWPAVNENGFVYLGSDVDAMRQGKAQKRGSPFYWKQGFLHRYAMSSVENDFNSICSALFMNRPQARRTSYRYPRIGKKLELAARFLHQVDPAFSIEYFFDL